MNEQKRWLPPMRHTEPITTFIHIAHTIVGGFMRRLHRQAVTMIGASVGTVDDVADGERAKRAHLRWYHLWSIRPRQLVVRPDLRGA